MTDEEYFSSLSPEEYLLWLIGARENFEDFVRLIHPTWELEEYQLDLIHKLDALEKRTLTFNGELVYRMMVNMPPRHSKSTLCTVLFPAWVMLRDPKNAIISSSYSGELSKDFGQQVRDLIQHPRAMQAFPEAVMNPDSRAKDVWKTTDGGSYFGVGLNGVTTGRPANLLIVDDPMKNREEAESAVMRNRVWNFYASSLENRKQPTWDGKYPIEVVVLTRWHPDDLGGRLQATEDWKEGKWLHVKYPAISKVGEEEVALWPARFPLEELKRKQRQAPREFESLYQQEPYILGGAVFRSDWWQFAEEMPKPKELATVIITVDTAFKTKETNDYSVALAAGMSADGNIYVLGVHRQRMEYPELKRYLVGLNSVYRGQGLRGIYIEDKASGQSLIQELRRETGIAVIPKKVQFDKVARAKLATPMLEGGRVFLPKTAAWLDEFLLELEQFPSTAHDDQVDAFVMALDELARIPVSGAGNEMQTVWNMANSLNRQLEGRKPDEGRWGEY